MAASDDALESIASHQIDILRVAAGLRQAAFDRLIELEAYLDATLHRNESLTVNKSARLSALLKQTQGTIAATYAKITDDQVDGLKTLAELEAKHAVKIVNGTIGADIVSVAISPKQLEAIVDGPTIFGNSARTWWEAQSEDLKAKFGAAMQQGLLLGETVDELARRVRGTKAAGYADGLMEAKKREADALVRSSAISTANEARLRTMADMGDLVKGVQWVATLDTRTTPICRALDGKVWRLPDYQPVGHDKKWPGPTAHWNCRSTQIPVLRSWEELSGKKLPTLDGAEIEEALKKKLAAKGWDDDKIAKATRDSRASMDGQEAKQTTFDDWMGKKGPAAVDRLLGPGRAKLWKEGKVTVSDLTNQNNRPLTLAQLAAKIERGIPAPETLGVDFTTYAKKDKPPRPAAAPDPAVEPDPADAEAATKITAALATKQHAKMMGAVMAEHADASPSVQWAVFQEKKLAYEVASQLNDTAAQKVADGKPVPTKITTILNKLADDDPAKMAWNDKVAKLKAEGLAAKANAAATAELQNFGSVNADHFDALAKAKADNPDGTPVEILNAAKAQLNAIAKTVIEDLTGGYDAVSKAAKAILAKTNGAPSYADLQELEKVSDKQTAVDFMAASPYHAELWQAKRAELGSASPAAITAAAEQAIKATISQAKTAWLNEDPSKHAAALQQATDDYSPPPSTIPGFASAAILKNAQTNQAAALITGSPLPDHLKLEAIKEITTAAKPWDAFTPWKKKIADAEDAAALDSFSKKSPMHEEAAWQALASPAPGSMMSNAVKILDGLAAAKVADYAAGSIKAHLAYKTAAKALLKANPNPTHDDLIAMEASAKATIANAVASTQLTTALKNAIAGKKLTAGQQAAVDALDAAGKAEFDAKVAAGKSNPVDATVAKIATGPDLNVVNVVQDGPNWATMEFVKSLPGSTNPRLFTDTTTGKQWVVKLASSTSVGHVDNEVTADMIYRAAGARVPFSKRDVFQGDEVKVAEFIAGGTELNTAGPSYYAKAREHFVLDALLGNWDAVGTGKNNLLIAGGEVWRIDNGGALLYRAMGAPKDAKWITREVQELKTLLSGAVNRDAADVYQGITADEIHRQIVDIIGKKDRILAAAAASPKVRDWLESRIEWLAEQLPPSMRAAAKPPPGAPEGITSLIPPDIDRRLKIAKTAGVAIAVDGPEIEDNNLLFWRELRGSAEVVRAQMKVTSEGSDKIIATLKKAGVNMSPPPPAASAPSVGFAKTPHPNDEFYQAIKGAAGTIAFHASDGQYNAVKVAALTPMIPKLSALKVIGKSNGDADLVAMADYYLGVIDDLQKAMTNKTAPTQFWNQYELKPKASPAPPVAAPKPAALDGWTVAKKATVDAPTGTLNADGVLVVSGANRPINAGEAFELTKGAVTVDFIPRRDIGNDGSTDRAKLGVVDIRIESTSSPAAIATALETLKELGLDTGPTTDAWKELLYLHKGFYLTKKDRLKSYQDIWNDAAKSPEQKVVAIRALAEKTFGITIPKDRSGWGPDYNPDGYTDRNGVGRRHWYRYDIPRSKMETEMAGWALYHSTSNMVAAVTGWLSHGHVTPTFDRYRTGVNVSATGGASASADMKSGGAVHFFLNVIRKADHAHKSGFRFKIRNLARIDTVSHHTDTFGSFDRYGSRLSSLADYRAMNVTGITHDHALLKGGMPFLEEIEEIRTSSPTERAAVLQAFADAGVAVLPDGRKVTDIVK